MCSDRVQLCALTAAFKWPLSTSALPPSGLGRHISRPIRSSLPWVRSGPAPPQRKGWDSPRRFSRIGRRPQADTPLGYGLYSLAAVVQRERLAAAPRLEQVGVVGAVGVARLAGAVHDQRAVPVAD